MSVALLGALLLMLASFKVFLWLTERTTVRQMNYERTRVAAGSHEPYGRMMQKPKGNAPAEPVKDDTAGDQVDRSKPPMSWHDYIEPKDIKGKPLKLNIFGVTEIRPPDTGREPVTGKTCKDLWEDYKAALWTKCRKVPFATSPCPNLPLTPASITVCPGGKKPIS